MATTSTITNLDVNVRATGTDSYSKAVDRSIRDSRRLESSLTGLDRVSKSDPFGNIVKSLTDSIPGLNLVVSTLDAVAAAFTSTEDRVKRFQSTSSKPIVVSTTADRASSVAASAAELASPTLAATSAGITAATASQATTRILAPVGPDLSSAIDSAGLKVVADMGRLTRVISARMGITAAHAIERIGKAGDAMTNLTGKMTTLTIAAADAAAALQALVITSPKQPLRDSDLQDIVEGTVNKQPKITDKTPAELAADYSSRLNEGADELNSKANKLLEDLRRLRPTSGSASGDKSMFDVAAKSIPTRPANSLQPKPESAAVSAAKSIPTRPSPANSLQPQRVSAAVEKSRAIGFKPITPLQSLDQFSKYGDAVSARLINFAERVTDGAAKFIAVLAPSYASGIATRLSNFGDAVSRKVINAAELYTDAFAAAAGFIGRTATIENISLAIIAGVVVPQQLAARAIVAGIDATAFAYKYSVKAFKNVFGEVTETIFAATKTGLSALLRLPFEVPKYLTTAFSFSKTVVAKSYEYFLDLADGVGLATYTGFALLGKSILFSGEGVGLVLYKAAQQLSKAGEYAGQVHDAVFDQVSKLAEVLVSAGDQFGSFKDKVKDKIGSAFTSITSVRPPSFDSVKSGLKSGAKSLGDTVKSAFDNVTDRLKSAGTKLFAASKSVAAAGFSGAKQAAGAGLRGAATVGKGALAVGVLGTAAAVGVAALNVGPSIDRIDELNDAAVKAGTSVNELSKIRFAIAVEGSGAVAEDADKAIVALQRSLAGAVDGTDKAAVAAFAKLGINAADAMKAGPLEAMLQISDGFAGIADPGQRLQLSMDLMGKSGIAIAAGLSQGRDALADSLQFADKNLSIQDASVAAAGQFNDMWDRAKLVIEGVYNRFAEKLLPSLVTILEMLSSATAQTGLMDTVLSSVTSLFELLADTVYQTYQYLQKAYNIAAAMASLDFSAAKDAYNVPIDSFSDALLRTKQRIAAESAERQARKADAVALQRAAELEEAKTAELQKQSDLLKQQAADRAKAATDSFDDLDSQLAAQRRLIDAIKRDPVGGREAQAREEEARKFQASLGGAGSDADPFGDRRSVFESQIKERDDNEAELRRLEEQKKLLESIISPEEAYLQRIEEIANLMRGVNDPGDRIYNRLVNQAKDQRDQAAGIDTKANATGGSLIESGSTALYQLLITGKKGTDDPLLTVSQDQLGAQLQGNTILGEMRDRMFKSPTLPVLSAG